MSLLELVLELLIWIFFSSTIITLISYLFVCPLFWWRFRQSRGRKASSIVDLLLAHWCRPWTTFLVGFETEGYDDDVRVFRLLKLVRWTFCYALLVALSSLVLAVLFIRHLP